MKELKLSCIPMVHEKNAYPFLNFIVNEQIIFINIHIYISTYLCIGVYVKYYTTCKFWSWLCSAGALSAAPQPSACLLWVISPVGPRSLRRRARLAIPRTLHDYVCSLDPQPLVHTAHVAALLKLEHIRCNLLFPIGCLRPQGPLRTHPPSSKRNLRVRAPHNNESTNWKIRSRRASACILNSAFTVNFCSLLG